jgi:hypothetical protein
MYMNSDRSFFRIHKATLIAAAVLSLAVMSIQFIPAKSDEYKIDPDHIQLHRFFSAERHMHSEFGWPYVYEYHINVYAYTSFQNVEPAVVDELESVKKYSANRINPNIIYLSAEALRQHAPLLSNLIQKTGGVRDQFRIIRIEKLFLLNFLIWTGGIIAFAAMLETALRLAERVPSTSQIRYATISPSDLRFSLLTFLIATLSLAVTLMLGLRPHVKETFMVGNSNVAEPPDAFIEFIFASEEARGWPWTHSKTNSYLNDRIQLQTNSPEFAEAKSLPLAQGGIAVSELNQKAPSLLQILRTRAAANPRPSETKFDSSRAIPNALTCLALAFTLGLITELLQRRRKKPSSAPTTPPPLTSP